MCHALMVKWICHKSIANSHPSNQTQVTIIFWTVISCSVFHIFFLKVIYHLEKFLKEKFSLLAESLIPTKTYGTLRDVEFQGFSFAS